MGDAKACCTEVAHSSSAAAAVTTVGISSATSRAKLGPARTAIRFSRPIARAITVLMRSRLPSSIPLVALHTIDEAGSTPAPAPMVSRTACEGTAQTSRESALRTAAPRSAVGVSPCGRCTEGR